MYLLIQFKNSPKNNAFYDESTLKKLFSDGFKVKLKAIQTKYSPIWQKVSIWRPNTVNIE
jgi:hypothetical protein